ncbi:hypothetical protein ACLKA7_003087 [Drosophila subpalustris]
MLSTTSCAQQNICGQYFKSFGTLTPGASADTRGWLLWSARVNSVYEFLFQLLDRMCNKSVLPDQLLA